MGSSSNHAKEAAKRQNTDWKNMSENWKNTLQNSNVTSNKTMKPELFKTDSKTF